MKIAVIDYGMGNLRSVIKKITKVGYEPILTSNGDEILLCDKLILPGVGHFEKGMRNLKSLNLIEIIREFAFDKKKPILGICLGMQMLTNYSEEGHLPGIGLIDARTMKFQFSGNDIKVPHMGWNSIRIVQHHPILNGIFEDEMFYFVHSFYVQCGDDSAKVAQTEYGIEFSSIIANENIIGVQFHPEKSHEWGELLIKNFCEL